MNLDMGKFVFVAFMFCILSDSNACFTSSRVHFIPMRIGSRFYQECRCDEADKEGVNLKWLDPDGQEIMPLRPGTESNVYSEWVDENTYRLFISSIGRSISGAYKCITKNDGHTYELTYNVEAYDRPYFINTNETQYVVSGKDATILCQARSETDPYIIWYKQDGITKIKDDDKYEVTSGGLVIKSVTNNDKGLYKCAASDLKTGEEIVRDIKVEVISLPEITEIVASPDSTVVVDGILTITCIAKGNPHPQYEWRKIAKYPMPIRNLTFPSQYARWKQEANKITIYDVNEDDAGAYECSASNDAGSSSGSINIDVLFQPEITKIEHIEAIEGSTAQMLCKAQGLPIPKMTMGYLGEEVDEQSVVWDTKILNDIEVESHLTFLRVNRSHEGIYICNATNFLDTDQKEINMTVLYGPHFDMHAENVWGWSGRNINLSCDNHSNPPANITWNYQGNDLSEEAQTEINNIMADKIHDNPLVLENVTLYGDFQCIASNEYGEDKKVISLIQGFVPSAINNVFSTNFKCCSIKTPNYVIKFKAGWGGGFRYWILQPHPTCIGVICTDHVTIRNITSTSVTFFIDGPEYVNGPAIIGYKAEYDEAENYNITDIHANRTWSIHRPFRINKLRPNTTYYIKFAAINDVGGSPWSEVFNFITLENDDFRSVPEEPVWETNIQLMAATDHIIKWKNDEPVDFYNIRYCPIYNGITKDSLCKDKIIEPAAEFQLNELDSNTTYYLELIAHNSNGSSTPAHVTFTIPAEDEKLLSAGALIGISIVVVFLVLMLLDVLLLLWRRQGIIANCCYKKKKTKREVSLNSRDRKGLLRDNPEPNNVNRISNSHKEYEYNKTTGAITGKHSAV